MRHLILRKRTQRLFLFLILAVGLYFTFRPKGDDRSQGFQFDSNLEKKNILQKSFFKKDETIKNIPFTGYINPLRKKAYFVLDGEQGKIFTNLAYLLHDKLIIKSKLEHVRFKNREISADILIAAKFFRPGLIETRSEKKSSSRITGLSGWATVKNLRIDKNKLLDIRSRFEFFEDKLKIAHLTFGDSYMLRGIVDLKSPYLVELNFKINRANIKDLAIIAMVKEPEAIYGIMEGKFFIKGRFDTLVSKGMLIGRNGRVGPFIYDSAKINFEGYGPILRLINSSVHQGGSTMTLEGLIDLRNIGKKNLYESVRINSDDKFYAWNGWDITKKGTRQLELGKDISEAFRVGFKTFAQERPLPYYENREDEVHLEYKMGDESLKMRLKEDEEFFGVEKSLKF